MIKTDTLINKIFSFLVAFLVVFQSIAPSLILAQETSPTPSEETTQPSPTEETSPSPTAEPETTPEPNPEPQETPQESVTPSPSPDQDIAEPTPEPTPSETLEPQPGVSPTPESSEATLAPSDQPINQSNPQENIGQPNAPPDAETSQASDSSQPSQDEPTQQGTLYAAILDNTSAESIDELDLDPQDVVTSGSLTTDKADYAPTDTAVIVGSDFPKSTDLNLIITAENYRFETKVTTDENGSFVYSYQLDGTFRPLYTVEAYDLAGNLLATITFTDTPESGCVTDSAGANDEPGQKDLTKMCVDYSGLPDNVDVDWNWDNSSWPGNNTGDGCSLFDTDGDGLVNYSLCVTVGGNPAAILTTTLYSCGDGKADRCTNPIAVLSPGPDTSCTASVAADDPFPAGSNYPNDTKANCSIDLDDVGGVGLAELVDVCSYPSSQPNSDPSDCIVFKDNTGRLEVVKDLIPSDNSGLFNLQIDSVTQAANVGDDGTTGEKVVTVGNHTVGETAGTNTSLGSYSSSIVCKDLNGSGSIVAQSGNSGPLTVSIEEGEDVVCVVTNTLNPSTIIVHKDVQGPNGEDIVDTSQNFTVRLDSFDPQSLTDGGTVTYNNVVPGDHTITEDTPPAGYDFYSIIPDSDSGTTGAQINVSGGGTVDVFVVNRQQASSLTLVKTVVNDNGGTAVADDFQAFINSNPVPWSTPQTLTAGSYTASEDVVPGYTASAWGEDCAADGTVSLALGEHKTCTVTNDDQAGTLIVKKIVVNDNGGTLEADDFSFQVNGGSVTSFESDGQNDLTVDAGTYTVTEPAVSGYTTTYDNCTDVVVPNGGSATCTVTNNDNAPSLTLVKVVDNGDGGVAVASAWTLTATGPTGFSGPGPTVNNGPSFDAGSYDLSESGPSGYTASAWVCVGGTQDDSDTVTIDLGDDVTCTITNDDNAPTLKLVKEVTNDNGGTAVASDWTLTATGDGGFSDSGNSTTFHIVKANEPYALSESTVAGYSSGDWSCNGGSLTGDTLTLDLDEDITCTITNDDIAPSLTLEKHVTNNNGGTASPADWTLTAVGPTGIGGTGPTVTSGPTFSAGTYTLSEAGPSGYTASSWTCSGGTQNGDQITIALGEVMLCEITNDDQAALLLVKKHVINDNGGTLDAIDFILNVTGNQPDPSSFPGSESGTVVILGAGSYSVDEDFVPGYLKTLGADCSGTIANGESKTCTITNDDIAPTLRLLKTVTNDNGGTAEAGDWDLTATGDVNGFTDNGATGGFHTVTAGVSYTLSEAGPSGYTAGSWGCDDGSLQGDTVTLDLDEDVTCEITNDDNEPSLTLVKEVVNDNGGDATGSDWILTADGPTGFSGAGPSVSNEPSFEAGTYDLSESGPSGYTDSAWVCVGGTQDDSDTVTIGLDDDVTCTITNDDIAPRLKLIKEVQDGNALAGDWTLTADGNSGFSDAGDSDIFHEVLANEIYTLSEDGPTGYTALEWDCGESNQEGDQIVLGLDEEVTCTITNTRDSGTITVIKDVEPDDESLWDILISGESSASATLADGESSGPHTLPTGPYTITEPTVLGYNSTFSCFEGENEPASGSGTTINIELAKDQDITCTFTNTFVPPELTITKTNNRLGIDVPPGSEVSYTLTVTLEGSPLTGVTLTDLLPNGFAYRGGSWTASSSVRGDLKGAGITPDPGYASPGTWLLGDMVSGEVVTLTLIADINTGIDLGLYKDLAWAKGSGLDSSEVLANEDSGVFVGTEVNVVKGPAGENYQVERTEERISEVLGAAIALPATGADAIWLILATILLISGGSLLVAGFRLRRENE